ncbi:hypothetical protein SBA3_1870002 [Candidatus Sulfopaludibacter sp. SbA3]|nr:hypothetical protein SBA3_1870002 [Candidatus Sulfopaludibacter sp. SbA3]
MLQRIDAPFANQLDGGLYPLKGILRSICGALS